MPDREYLEVQIDEVSKSLYKASNSTGKIRIHVTKDWHKLSWEERDPDLVKKILETEKYISNAIFTLAEIVVDFDTKEEFI